MKFYGFKRSSFCMAYRMTNKCRQLDFYDALKRAGRKRERQAAKKDCQHGW